MASVNDDPSIGNSVSAPLGSLPERPIYHRIRTVRLRQGVSLRTVARRTGIEARVLRIQEEESCDMRLSELRRWQAALDVPIAELLVDSDAPLSAPVLQRARFVRLMKTAAAMREQAPNSSIQCMAEQLIQQLIEIMPELAHVGAWHTYGQRRSLDECGRIAERCLSDDAITSADDD